jgi:FAD:protein FMN transferase
MPGPFSLFTSIATALLVFVPFFALPQGVNHSVFYLHGKTMGTTWNVTYFDTKDRNFQNAIDSILLLINKSLSTYDPQSEVSTFNRSQSGIKFQLPFLCDVLKKAASVYKGSRGAFDPTVQPLVNAWGFGPEKKFSKPEKHDIDSMLAFVGFDKLFFDDKQIRKSDPRLQLDFGGIGQGFAVDVIYKFLRGKGIENLLVELGGEGMTLGKNLTHNRNWQISILDPLSTLEHQFPKLFLSISGLAFTTSGNYFNYREIEGVKYGHTLNPRTGYPVQNTLLSATVFAKDCTSADAWATAFMVMGVDEAMEELRSRKDIDGILIYSTAQGDIETFITPNIQSHIITQDR